MWRLRIHYRKERHWDSWISTSGDTGVIMHLYLSSSSSPGPYHKEIHFSVRRCWCFCFKHAPTAETEICLNTNVCGRRLEACFAVRARKEVRDHRWSSCTQEKHILCLPAFLLKAVTDGIGVFQYVCFKLAPSCSLSKCPSRTSHLT